MRNRTRITLHSVVFLAMAMTSAALFPGCETDPGSPTPQSEPILIGRRLYRGDMGDRHGLLFYAAQATTMTLVYDTVKCGLVAAWKGPVLGPLRDGSGGYAPQGKVYQQRQDARFWTVLMGGDTVAAKLRFAGFSEDSTGSLALHYALDLPGGRILRIDENPVHDDHYGYHALFRNFTFEGLDSNTVLRTGVSGSHPVWAESVSVEASGTAERMAGEVTLVMTYDGVSVVKTTWIGSGDI